MIKNDFLNPKEIYITCDSFRNYKIFLDEPTLGEDGKFYSKNGSWTDLDINWELDSLKKGSYIKYSL